MQEKNKNLFVGYFSSKINRLADIYPGQSLRKGIKNEKKGRFFIIQMKDVSIGRRVKTDHLYRINLKAGSTPKLIKKGDLLFVSRAWRDASPFSVLVEEDIENLIAAPLFYIIRVKVKTILPEYLNWYINSDYFGKVFFKRYAMGTTVLNIPKNILNNMDVVLPPLDVQKKIIESIKLFSMEKKIMTSLHEKRKTLINLTIKEFEKRRPHP